MESLQSIQHIISVCSMPMAVLDREMKYIAVSEKWASLYQLTVADWIGQTLVELPKDVGNRWTETFEESLQGNSQLGIKDTFLASDGTMISTELDFLPYQSTDGDIEGMVIIAKGSKTENVFEKHDYVKPFIEELPGLCWITDKDYRLKYGNAYFYQKLRLSPEIIGKSNVDIFGHELASIDNSGNAMVLKAKKAMEFNQVVRDANGHPQVYKVYKFPLSNVGDSYDMVGSIAFNTTKSTMIEEELYNSEAQFKLAFEHSLIGMALISPEGMLKRVNKSLCKMLGYSPEELIQRSIKSITYPDDLTSTENMLEELNSGKIEQIKYEKRYLHKNGSIIWVVIAATMLYNNAGKPLYYVSQIEDITKRKEIENDLLLSEKKYRTIFENVQDVFYQTDQNGLVIEISPSIEQYSGFSRQEIIGKPVANFYFYPNDRERIIEQLRTNGHVIDFEVRLKTKDKQLRYASVNARLIIENGAIIATEGSMRDVTTRKFQENALKALNNELTASNEQKSKLLSIIGHDLRNPISGSLQLIELACEESASSTIDEMHSYLTMISKELSNANNLLEDLLNWAKSQFEVVSFNPVVIPDVSKLIEKCMQTILPMATKKGIHMSFEVPQDLAITADVAMLETIIRNLLSNAVKFTDKGEVKLKAEEQTAAVKFSVCDSGIGMSKEKIKDLFTKKIADSTFGTSGEKGTGLGLGLCNDFVNRHGGTFWAESEVGKGSVFSFTIPSSLHDLAKEHESLANINL